MDKFFLHLLPNSIDGPPQLGRELLDQLIWIMGKNGQRYAIERTCRSCVGKTVTRKRNFCSPSAATLESAVESYVLRIRTARSLQSWNPKQCFPFEFPSLSTLLLLLLPNCWGQPVPLIGVNRVNQYHSRNV